MLVLNRKIGQRIFIGDNITVIVVRVEGGGVRLGIEAPPEVAIVRDDANDAEERRNRKRVLENTPP